MNEGEVRAWLDELFPTVGLLQSFLRRTAYGRPVIDRVHLGGTRTEVLDEVARELSIQLGAELGSKFLRDLAEQFPHRSDLPLPGPEYLTPSGFSFERREVQEIPRSE